MGPVLLLIPAASMALAAYVYRHQARQASLLHLEEWRGVAEAVGLTHFETSWAGVLEPTAVLTARSGVLRIQLSSVPNSRVPKGESGARNPFTDVISITGMGHRPGDLEIRPETLGTSVGKALGAREIELGDPAFDSNVYLRGDNPLIHALFDPETRRLVVGLVNWIDTTVSLADGELRVEIPDALVAPTWLAETVSSSLAVARCLARPADIASRLAANLQSDPVLAVRLQNLRILVREYPGRPATTRALRAALADDSIEMRFQAAMALGDEGRETLLAIASAEDGQAEAALAIAALGKRLPRERVRAILDHALRSRRLAVARACLEVLGERSAAESVEPLARVLAIERGELAEAAAQALGTTGRPEAEAPLLAALGHRDDAVELAATVALGRCGSAAAVAQLRRLESTSRGHACRRAAREAVAQIQSRLTGADPGQLSLAGGESGQLSLTDDKAGRVALLEDDNDATSGESGPGSQN